MPVAPKPVHEVWVDPGWPNEQRPYRGDDPEAAALTYAASVQRFVGASKDHYEILWTIDGVVHQAERGGRITA